MKNILIYYQPVLDIVIGYLNCDDILTLEKNLPIIINSNYYKKIIIGKMVFEHCNDMKKGCDNMMKILDNCIEKLTNMETRMANRQN